MKVAVILIVDEESQNKINGVRKILNDHSIPDNAVKINHITLADIEINESQIEQVKSIVKNFAKSHHKVKMQLEAVGSFMKQKNVLFYTPILDENLINLNSELVCALSEKVIECNALCIKNKWLPHLTIAIKVNDEQLVKSFKLLRENNILPLFSEGEKIQLLCHDPKPYKEIETYELN